MWRCQPPPRTFLLHRNMLDSVTYGVKRDRAHEQESTLNPTVCLLCGTLKMVPLLGGGLSGCMGTVPLGLSGRAEVPLSLGGARDPVCPLCWSFSQTLAVASKEDSSNSDWETAGSDVVGPVTPGSTPRGLPAPSAASTAVSFWACVNPHTRSLQRTVACWVTSTTRKETRRWERRK